MMLAVATQRATPVAAAAAKARPQAAKAAKAGRALPQQQRPSRRGAARQQLAAGAGRRGTAVVAVAAAPDVSVSEERLEGCGVRLTISVPPEMCQQAYKKVMDDLRKGTTVGGFRKGKAPDAALVTHVGGPQRVANSALGELLEPVVAQAMKAYEAVLVPDSEHIEQGAEELEARFSLEGGLTFSVRFDALPQLRWKTPYRELQVAVESAGDAAGDAAAVEEKLLSLRKGSAKLRVVPDRGLQRGDLAIVDFSAKRADTGEELVGASRSSMRIDTDDADRTFLPGIVDIVTGMRPGEEKQAPLRFPSDEAFQPAPLRGVEASVTVKVTELFAYDLPEMNDEWANSILAGAGLAGLREQLLAAQAAEREATQRERIADAFAAAVARAVEVEIPDSLLNELGRQQYSTELNRLLSRGQLSYETVQQLATPELAMQFVESRRGELLDLQRSILGLDDIADAEGLAPSEQEIEAEFSAAAADFQRYGQEFDAERLREQIQESVKANKVMAWLTEHCAVNILPQQAP